MVLLVIILRLLSYLPLGVLYWISDITAFLLAHVIKYRSEVIKRNLSHAFPDLNPQQQRILMREFYKYLSDQLVETIKLQRLTRDQLSKRIHYVNPELMNRLINEKKNIVILMGHCGNWEWAGAATAFSFNAPTFPVSRFAGHSSCLFYWVLSSPERFLFLFCSQLSDLRRWGG